MNLNSPNGTLDGNFMQNYADIHLTDPLSRIKGVASINNFALRKYAMRIWLDTQRLTNMGMTAMDVEDALREQNNQVAAGKLGQPPVPSGQSFTYQLNVLGRLEAAGDKPVNMQEITEVAMAEVRGPIIATSLVLWQYSYQWLLFPA